MVIFDPKLMIWSWTRALYWSQWTTWVKTEPVAAHSTFFRECLGMPNVRPHWSRGLIRASVRTSLTLLPSLGSDLERRPTLPFIAPPGGCGGRRSGRDAPYRRWRRALGDRQQMTFLNASLLNLRRRDRTCQDVEQTDKVEDHQEAPPARHLQCLRHVRPVADPGVQRGLQHDRPEPRRLRG